MKTYHIKAAHIKKYINYLKAQERTEATIEKYNRDITALRAFLQGGFFTKTQILKWKEQLIAAYAPATVNGMLASVNGFFSFCGWPELKLKGLKIQRNLFCRQEKELTKQESLRLCAAAKSMKNERLLLILQTICATGIRISELQYITAEALLCGRAVVHGKGKLRTVLLPQKLCCVLRRYCKRQKKTAGAIFTTRSGKPVDRSNIWRDMKALCQSAGVSPQKVFPHNLRHLFARTFYTNEKDLSRLADILGHSSIETTRIYTVESGAVHVRQLDRMRLLL